MIYLLASVVCTTVIGVVFKKYPDFNIDTFQAIIYNYWVCAAFGLLLGNSPFDVEFWNEPYFPYAIALSLSFVSGFVFIAKTVEYFGISVATLMQKMSLIFTVCFAIVLYQESVNILKISGILLAVLAVVLTNYPDGNNEKSHLKKWMFALPIITLFVSGFVEVVLQYAQETYLKDGASQASFTTLLFFLAGMWGLLILIFSFITKRMTFAWKNVVGGFALGIPNYGSILFILLMIKSGLEGSVAFPINNVLVILASIGIGILFFKETLSKINKFGILAAIASICLIAFA